MTNEKIEELELKIIKLATEVMQKNGLPYFVGSYFDNYDDITEANETLVQKGYKLVSVSNINGSLRASWMLK